MVHAAPFRLVIPIVCGILWILTAPAGRAGDAFSPHLPVAAWSQSGADRADALLRSVEGASLSALEGRPGDAATGPDTEDGNAFTHPSGNIGFENGFLFRAGKRLFDRTWTAEAEGGQGSGLGPLYNAASCQACHRRDGRGRPPENGDATSFVIRLSLPGKPGMPPRPDPMHGWQVQDRAIPGVPPEFQPAVRYEALHIALSDNETATLRRPVHTLTGPGYGPPDARTRLSPRIAQQLIGLGLLEAVPASAILSGADPEDADGDGVSGRVAWVWSRDRQRLLPGRFGHKAAMATLRDQVADAFAVDMGLTSALMPDVWGDCTAQQRACRAAAGDRAAAPEVSDEILDLVTFYTRNLAVPARRGFDAPDVLHGKSLFHAAGCAACHRPAFVTHRLIDRPEQSGLLIWPYTDLLLHDMGEGLADHRPEGAASGREWRTPPLWGIGRTAAVSGQVALLHDGRARSILEAVLWHGGEGAAARDTVISMPAADRAALIRFVESL